MNLLILGAAGMLGHELVASLSSRHAVTGTIRGGIEEADRLAVPRGARITAGVDALRFATVEEVLRKTAPDAVVNAIGVIKQVMDATDEDNVREINSRFPHRLAACCREAGVRVLHLSTDCVFTGAKGMYRETDTPDATDLYGRSKLEGELTDEGCITLRTSMIGPEIGRKNSLIEWFLSERGPIRGYRRAIFSGFTTRELARIIERVLVDYPDKSGLYHVSSEPIDKYSLLLGLRDRLGMDIEIEPYDEFECDRSLHSARFRSEFAYTPPTWDAMLDELSEQIRGRNS